MSRRPPAAASSFLKRGHSPTAAKRKEEGGGYSGVDDLGDDSLVVGNSPVPPPLTSGPPASSNEANGGGVDGAPSIPASQLFSQVGGAGYVRPERQRPRFHTVQDLDLALNQAIEGRINSKNAWASKEASDLLEGITHTIESTLDANTVDDYSGFTKVATVVEGCSKVWTVRVDSTYQQSNQMVQRLLRNEEAEEKDTAEGAGDGNDEAHGNHRRRHQRSAAATAAAARTLALNASEINLDNKAKTALTQTGINAQFRAITEKFDQGNAQGLLLNNAPLGAMGNVILDVDYARVEGEFSTKKARLRRNSAEFRAQADGEAEDDEEEEGTRGVRTRGVKPEPLVEQGRGEAATPPSRRSLLCVEQDLDIDAVLDDLPDLTPTFLPEHLQQQHGSRSASGLMSHSAASASARPSGTVLDALLVLPHAAMKQEFLAEATSYRASLERPSGSSHLGAAGNDKGRPTLEGERRHTPLQQYDDDDDDGGDGGGDGGAWDGPYDGDEEREEGGNGDGHPDDDTYRDVGHAARKLVSGLSEMEAVDAYLDSRRVSRGGMEGGEEEDAGGRPASLLASNQLALEAEDPSSWCPLTDASTNRLSGIAPKSELSQIRKRHHIVLTQQRPGSASGALSSAAVGANGGDVQNPSPPPAKRGRKEKTVVFRLSELEGLPPSAASLLHMSKTDVDGSALKQSTTATKNVTALGKEILFGKDAGHAVLAYTQSTVQRAKAEQANLVMPADPVPGESIPSYLAYPITIDGFFQPFLTSQPSWNMLRKSASGSLLDSQNTRRHGSSRSSLLRGGPSEADDDDGGGGTHESDMPVPFFAGDGAEADMDSREYSSASALYNAVGGGGGAGGDDDAAVNEEAAYRQAELQLLRQFDSQHQLGQGATTDADMATVVSSAIASARSSGQLFALMDPLELMRVLEPTEGILSAQIDVVKLRHAMWAALQELVGIADRPKEGATANGGPGDNGEKGKGRENKEDDEEDEDEEDDGRHPPQPRQKESLLKPALLGVLSQRRDPKRKTKERPQPEESGAKRTRDGNEKEDGEEDAAASALRPRGEDESEAPSGASGKLVFSDVVEALLPQVSLISSTGTLSPAFFFFSLLFLANEHNIVLTNVQGLDDLVIDENSLIRGGGEIHRRTTLKRRRLDSGQTATRA